MINLTETLRLSEQVICDGQNVVLSVKSSASIRVRGHTTEVNGQVFLISCNDVETVMSHLEEKGVEKVLAYCPRDLVILINFSSCTCM